MRPRTALARRRLAPPRATPAQPPTNRRPRVFLATTPLEGFGVLTPLADAGLTAVSPHAVVVLADGTGPAVAFDLVPINPLDPRTAARVVAARAPVPATWRERSLPAGAPRHRIACVGPAVVAHDLAGAVAAARARVAAEAAPTIHLDVADCRHAAVALASELTGVDANAALARAAAGSREG